MARKSRHQKNTQQDTPWRAAGYLRISREDGDKEESDSISSQRDIVESYIQAQDDLTLSGRYVDDGWTGTNFDRPDFQRLLEDMQRGLINCVVVKDLSRLGRNYILVGQYLEMIFPLRNIRFISINDRIDSVKEPSSLNNAMVSFKNVMNDEYCRDISNKVRSSLDRKRNKGEFIGSFAAYGYRKDPLDRHHLVIDPPAAEVVQDIFRWYTGGMSILGIARQLNRQGVPNPSAYKRQCGLAYRHPANEKNDALWPDSSVRRILKNSLYTGDMVQAKTRIKSYKVQVCTSVPEAEWIVVPDTHEAIIPREQFEAVQRLLARDTRTAPGQTQVHLFAGYLRCADCQRAMARKTVSQPYGSYAYYVCQTYRKGGRDLCTKHTIREDKLQRAVLTTIQSQIALAVSMEELLRERKRWQSAAEPNRRLEAMRQAQEAEREKLRRCRDDLYPDWKTGILSKEEYLSLKKKFDAQLTELEEASERLSLEIARCRSVQDKENRFLTSFLHHQNLEHLTREVVVELIDRIEVHEGGNITIHFNYQDEYQRLLDQLPLPCGTSAAALEET